MAVWELDASQLKEKAKELRTFDRVLLSGTIYTARDAAHKKIRALLAQGQELPFALDGATIYYAGPTPSPDHLPIGSCGPTTSGRMDVYAPGFLDLGLSAMIGKGQRNQAVVDAIVRNQAVYLCAIGGAGALACKCIQSCEVIAFPELGCESVKRLTIERFPLIVAIDAQGNDIFKQGKERYQSSLCVG
ncbi:MAG: FumA C-terminus/TtdB family hydratase beta subunit [Massiliimalia sp.]|jgi:fumarate hydratase subunit beta